MQFTSPWIIMSKNRTIFLKFLNFLYSKRRYTWSMACETTNTVRKTIKRSLEQWYSKLKNWHNEHSGNVHNECVSVLIIERQLFQKQRIGNQEQQELILWVGPEGVESFVTNKHLILVPQVAAQMGYLQSGKRSCCLECLFICGINSKKRRKKKPRKF